MLSQHEGSSSQAAELCCSQTEAKGGDEWGGHSACFKSFRDQEEQQGLGGFGRAALEAPGICLAGSRGRTSFGGARPCPGHTPVAMLAADLAQATSHSCAHMPSHLHDKFKSFL